MLGHGEKWQGGDYMAPGGGQRIRLLKEALEEMKEEQEKTILFIDRYVSSFSWCCWLDHYMVI